MKTEELNQLDNEVTLGHKARIAYDSFIKPFVLSKRQDLFNNFCDIPMDQTELILETKRLIKVIDQLEEEILAVINTGKLAAKTLGEQNATNS